MSDPLTQVIELLRPRAIFSKGISGAGRWAVRYSAFGHPGFCAVLEGRCRLMVDGEEPATLEQGDFVLLPATPAFTMAGFEPAIPALVDPVAMPVPSEEVRHGRADGPPDVQLLGGYFAFDTPDAEQLVPLLPSMIHIRGIERLTTLVRLVAEEAQAENVGRELVLTRLVEILLVEALRTSRDKDTPPGLLRGLSDQRVAKALRDMHADPRRAWTVVELADAAGMSRSSFFDRFTRVVGLRPMEYLMAWRMALAKDMLRHEDMALDEVARRVGYGSASTFSTAFSRHVGQPPGRYARAALN
ncbi:AraC family transcriptional regulator [Bradyrhizobium sp. Leo121]|uniref:AraC family transcriptional regulator n=1 Tax=Bradyrhizobium sp. Leo121 TaxID=1571195 RepID=UPI001028F25B|nr:AraC family transcriptional regulator [Bradyrhizobium sp. Leo121]RZN34355.1 AraC family transcriptional regulator [Bradyrhizobium sp. Leo121]